MLSLTDSIDALTRAIYGLPPIDVQANTGDAQIAIDDLTAGLLDVSDVPMPTISVEDNATPTIGDITTGLDGLDGLEATTQVTADTGDALTGLDSVDIRIGDLDGRQVAVAATADVTSALSGLESVDINLRGINGNSATVFAFGNNTDAIGKISEARGALGNLNGNTATVNINAVDSASGVIGAVKGALDSLNGRTATSYIKTVNITEFQTIGRAAGGNQLGGVVQSFAYGGVADLVTIYAAEGNRPEIAHFAGGGTALLSNEGYYGVPAHTYISPSNAVGNSSGGDTYHFHIGGSVITENELIGRAAEAIWATEVEEDIRHRLASGVTA